MNGGGSSEPSFPAPRARVWSETVAYEDLGAPAVLALLRRFGVAVDVAVRPWDLGRVGELAARCEAHGVPLGVWPMLDDGDGRWANVHNARIFRELALRAVDACSAHDARGPSGRRGASRLVVDLEPSFAVMDRLLGRFVAADHAPARDRSSPDVSWLVHARAAWRAFEPGRGVLRALVDEARSRGIEAAAAVLPPVLFAASSERVLGTPIRGVDFTAVSSMAYTSIVEGWSRGAVSRRRAVRLLAWTCDRAARLLGPRAAISLGAVGVGAFGDEPTYRDPRELAEDARVARAAGIGEISLLDLGGVLTRRPAEPWLAALVGED